MRMAGVRVARLPNKTWGKKTLERAGQLVIVRFVGFEPVVTCYVRRMTGYSRLDDRLAEISPVIDRPEAYAEMVELMYPQLVKMAEKATRRSVHEAGDVLAAGAKKAAYALGRWKPDGGRSPSSLICLSAYRKMKEEADKGLGTALSLVPDAPPEAAESAPGEMEEPSEMEDRMADEWLEYGPAFVAEEYRGLMVHFRSRYECANACWEAVKTIASGGHGTDYDRTHGLPDGWSAQARRAVADFFSLGADLD